MRSPEIDTTPRDGATPASRRPGPADDLRWFASTGRSPLPHAPE